jgi:hypothetical protein
VQFLIRGLIRPLLDYKFPFPRRWEFLLQVLDLAGLNWRRNADWRGQNVKIPIIFPFKWEFGRAGLGRPGTRKAKRLRPINQITSFGSFEDNRPLTSATREALR